MTKQRGRKRKFSECKENMPPKIRIDRTKIVLNEQDWMPAAATEFYNSKHYERLRMFFSLNLLNRIFQTKEKLGRNRNFGNCNSDWLQVSISTV